MLAIVFGGISLTISWVPILNNVSFYIAIISLILGVIALIVNRKNKKVLAIVGTCLSVASIIIVLVTQSMYSSAIDNASKAIDKASSSIDAEYSKSSSEEASKEAEADAKFKWTDAYFDSIVDGTTTYDEIVATVGEPNTTRTDTDYDADTDSEVPSKDCDWDLEDGSYYASVSIHFVQKNGTYVVDSKTGSGLK
ncbi:CD20-like domain-containing protein [Streptococcus thermophilus]|uniref:CD20-like domain-containing protein n=1 Tax=Streptococcus thermophilus TaxID=1308 RepID=UPI0022FDB7D9|nr:CD20-like domain-containing protein [Streptococcus thermophilus]MDA5509274.1 CD20-like domain-containing protein [Streptococcus thermophilus]MDA5539454.1 CD20-like domain-containing protein [Streptococcus thermophilus]MDA5550868.1 CD20-like domain-containing protein [Streptococcus thermophilus]